MTVKPSVGSVDMMVRLAVHHAVEACKSATGRRRVIDNFVNKTHIANEVMQALREVIADSNADAAALLKAGAAKQEPQS